MNPFTKYLRQWSANNDLSDFIDLWDRLERVVVGVYREKMTLEKAAAEYEVVWPRLRARYQTWEPQLRPYWQKTRAAGAPTVTDPFQLLLDLPEPTAISGNWPAMQHLPAAREALNQYLVDQSTAAGGSKGD